MVERSTKLKGEGRLARSHFFWVGIERVKVVAVRARNGASRSEPKLEGNRGHEWNGARAGTWLGKKDQIKVNQMGKHVHRDTRHLLNIRGTRYTPNSYSYHILASTQAACVLSH
jgi:hypothetical protein